MGAKLSGVAVHIGARIASLAEAGEVLVSSTVMTSWLVRAAIRGSWRAHAQGRSRDWRVYA